jgi:hypothetical protein
MENVKLLIKIQSASDIITNSSSEVFLCKNTTDMTAEQLKDFIYQYNEEHQYTGDWEEYCDMEREEKEKYDVGGGMGGFLDVKTYKEAMEDEYDYVYFEDLKDPESYILVDTDWCHLATIKWITENLNARYA